VIELVDTKLHASATRPVCTRCFMNGGTARHETAWQCDASSFIPGVLWVTELVDTKLHDSGTRPVYTGYFMNGITARHEYAWQCHASVFIQGVSCTIEMPYTKLHDSATRLVYTECFMNGGTARHELVSTWSYGYLEKLNAQIAGLNADRIMIVSHVPYVRSEKFRCVCLCEYSNSRVPWEDAWNLKIGQKIMHILQDVTASVV
jgi:hypothetical protein